MIEKTIIAWANNTLNQPAQPIKYCQALQGDASPRQYFRVYNEHDSFVVASVCPNDQSHQSFVMVSDILKQQSIKVPKIIGTDFQAGLLLLEDLGDKQLLSILNQGTVESFYQQGFAMIAQFFQIPLSLLDALPHYQHDLLNQELDLFEDYFINNFLSTKLTDTERQSLHNIKQRLIKNALDQPQVFVHRDYHSRNLMMNGSQLTTIDFQDAVVGPITYDFVSFIKDCYVQWSVEQVNQWIKSFWLQHQVRFEGVSLAKFTQWVDWMGLQRHLKVLGIFSRLAIRDNKKTYLNDLPCVMRYVVAVVRQYPELNELQPILDRLVPKMHAELKRVSP